MGITALIVEERIDRPQLKASYPRVERLPDPEVQRTINGLIDQMVGQLIANPQPGYEPGKTDITLTYQVGVNRESVLSLRFEVYSFVEMAAHGFTQVKSLTVNLETGQVYQLSDLFKPGSNYQARINEIIKQQIKEKEIPTINEFVSISENQEFYLTNNDLVIYFQLYEYTPHYVGIPEFNIPYAALADIINPQGPIAMIYVSPTPVAANPRINIRYTVNTSR